MIAKGSSSNTRKTKPEKKKLGTSGMKEKQEKG